MRRRELTYMESYNFGVPVESALARLHVARPVMGLVSGPGYTSNF